MNDNSNLNLQSIRTVLEKAKGPNYWRSLDELFSVDGFKEFLHREFPRQAGEWIDDEGRRNFIKLMGASLALAGLTACTKQPTEFLVPYVQQPEDLVPGKPSFFATAFPIHGVANPVLVETHSYRPTKVEGNPEHPASLGGADVPTQASVLGLYDPDRLQTVNYIGETRSYIAFLQAMIGQLAIQRGKNGAGIRILTETVTSPTLYSQIQAILKDYPQAKWYQWEPLNHGQRMGTYQAFGQFLNPVYKFDQADVVLSIDGDFLSSGTPGMARYSRDFISKRVVRGGKTTQSRYYAVETTPANTGAKADHRQAIKPSEVVPFVRALAAALGAQGASTGSAPEVANGAFFKALVRDLQGAQGRSIVIAGGDQLAETHALVHYINQQLGNIGKTVQLLPSLEQKPVDQLADVQALVNDLNSNQVDLLFIVGGNPAFNAPPALNMRGAIQHAKMRVRLAQHDDETTEICQWVVPEAHAYEQWSDAPAYDGTMTIMQPLIAPLYNGKSAHELLAAFSTTPEMTSSGLVRDYWQSKQKTGDFETWWRHSIHDGFIKDSAPAPVNATAKLVSPQGPREEGMGNGFEISFHRDPYILDGRYVNNAWLQELPRPMSKLTWDNAVIVSHTTAQQLGVSDEDQVEVTANGYTVKGSIWRVAGQPDGSIALTLGWGHRRLGRAAIGAGFDAYPLRSMANLAYIKGGQVRKTGDRFRLAATQHHFSMEGREPVKEGTLAQFLADPAFAERASETPNKGLTMFPQTWEYHGYAWGMAIDLTSCVGCNSCVAACQSENNIAVVGKEQVLNTREMHWIRIDRYYKGSAGNPETFFEPMMCVQCENAPCEIVCPVAATSHDQEGLNNMVYNRCVGTRYCSNNCPYKVRRFNFLLFTDWETESVKLQRNPDVTVRSRGVMEKCTFCVQRINYAKITAEKQDRRVYDGEIVPACAATCPTQAIMFGDLNDPKSKVRQWKAEKLNFSVLGELNTRPRATHLAEIRNPDPALKAGETS